MPFPLWLRRETVSGIAEWDRRGASAPDVARTLLDHLHEADELLGSGLWVVNSARANTPIELDGRQLLEHVQRSVFRDDEGVEHLSAGYHIQLSKESSGGFHSIRASVGSTDPGRNLPSNHIVLTIGAPERDGLRVSINSDFAAAAFRSMIRVWSPDSAALRNGEALTEANREERGAFPPLVGQWAWISDRVGAIEASTPRVTTAVSDGGTYLYADDDLDAVSAVHEVRATFETNSLFELPFER